MPTHHALTFRMAHLAVVAILGAAAGLAFTPREAAAGEPSPDITGYCKLDTNSAIFKAGKEVVLHSVTHPGAENTPGTVDHYEVVLPTVIHAATQYNTTGHTINLYRGDDVVITACGCVQTGGSGSTWKSYVDPKGDNSDKLYHGLVSVPNAAKLGLPMSPTVKSLVRLSDLISWQDKGNKLHIDANHTLTLGYEDDKYKDNGYWSHDDGNDDQCKGVGGAAVSIIVSHDAKTPR